MKTAMSLRVKKRSRIGDLHQTIVNLVLVSLATLFSHRMPRLTWPTKALLNLKVLLKDKENPLRLCFNLSRSYLSPKKDLKPNIFWPLNLLDRTTTSFQTV